MSDPTATQRIYDAFGIPEELRAPIDEYVASRAALRWASSAPRGKSQAAGIAIVMAGFSGRCRGGCGGRDCCGGRECDGGCS